MLDLGSLGSDFKEIGKEFEALKFQLQGFYIIFQSRDLVTAVAIMQVKMAYFAQKFVSVSSIREGAYCPCQMSRNRNFVLIRMVSG